MRKKGGGPIIQTLSICFALSIALTAVGPFVPKQQREQWEFRIAAQSQPQLPEMQKAPFIFPYTQEEVDMIAAVVMHEVGYCSRESKIAVTYVILNRLKDGRFGSNIYEVLHKDNQFSAIQNYYSPQILPDEACRNAVKAALSGEDNSYGALYFCNPAYVNSDKARRWFSSLELVFTLDNQNYYK